MSKNAGPAFPFNERHDDGSHHHSHDGMSLRDWFASHASQADIAVRRKAVPADECRVIHSCTREEAKYAYADAMLKAREA